MPAPKTVTPERVFEAADRLMDKGVPFVEITNSRVRSELGKGSFEDINPLLREWKTNRTNASIIGIEVPEQFRTELNEFGSRIWRMVASEAMEKAASKLANYQRIERERDDLYAEVDAVNAKLGSLTDNVNALNGALAKLNMEVAVHHGKLSVYCDKADAEGYMQSAELLLADIEQRLSDITGLHPSTEANKKTPKTAAKTSKKQPA